MVDMGFYVLGNTNSVENTFQVTPAILQLLLVTLTLQPNDSQKKFFLYWVGYGTGDFNVKLNGVDIIIKGL
jgi:uncharacterized membrane protein YukC